MNKRARIIERIQNILIAVLLCSALLLIGQSTLYHELGRLLGFEESGTAQSRPNGGHVGSAEMTVKPYQLMLQCQGGRYGVQYNQELVDQLYDSLLSFRLKEAIGGVESVRKITEEAWREKILSGQTWIYYDFPGTMPLLELSAWLGQERENPILSGKVCFFLLEETQDGVILSYRNEADGQYYESNCISSREGSLALLLTGITGNGAIFVFEQESYADFMNPYTIIIPEAKKCPVYTVKNPLEEISDEAWAKILAGLSFNPKAYSYEAAKGTQVQTEGEESLRLAKDGTLSYENQGSEAPKLYVDDLSVRSRVEYAKSILDLLTAEQLGDAKSYLASVDERSDGSLLVRFSYSLGGVPVQLMRDGYAAEFRFSGGVMTNFEVHIRNYTKTEMERSVLPAKQAIAIFLDLNLQGRELILSYIDGGEGGELSVSWAAL